MSKAAELANLIGNINAGGGGVNRNLIINGAMNVSQRSTSVSSVTSGGYKALDRYQVDYNGSHAWTISQDSDTPNGFGSSMKFLCTTAQALSGSQRIAFRQKIEGHNLQGTKKGTSDAESVTASFYVKSNKTGTYILEYFDIDNQRHINKAYTVDTANTWEYKSITFEADTSGSFDNDVNASAQLHFWLGAGSTYTSGTLQSSWGSNVTANRAVGNVNLADTVNNYWQITGIQFELGQNPTTFEHENRDVTLHKCYRYFYATAFIGTGVFNSTSQVLVSLNPPNTFRVQPSVSMKSGVFTNINVEHNDQYDISGVAFAHATDQDYHLGINPVLVVTMPSRSGYLGNAGLVGTDRNDDAFFFSAEL